MFIEILILLLLSFISNYSWCQNYEWILFVLYYIIYLELHIFSVLFSIILLYFLTVVLDVLTIISVAAKYI